MKTRIVLASLILSTLFLTSSVFAQDIQTPSPSPSPRSEKTPQPRRERAPGEIKELKVAEERPVKNLLEGNKLRSCQARESAIKNRTDALVKLVTNMEDKFTSIATRVEEFYAGSGKTIANYDELVLDISTKKTQVDTDLALAKTNAGAFKCDGDNPKDLLNQFRLDMQKVKEDLKEYRTSIRKLIVAIYPLAPKETEKPETEESESTANPTLKSTPTATSTGSPTPTP